MGKPRDTYKYDFVGPNRRILHLGITNDLDRREAEHKRERRGTSTRCSRSRNPQNEASPPAN